MSNLQPGGRMLPERLSERGVGFWINLALVGFYLFFIWPLLQGPMLGWRQALSVAVLVLPAIGVGYLAVVGRRRANLVLLLSLIGVVCAAEIAVRIFERAPASGFLDLLRMRQLHPYYLFTGRPGMTGMSVMQQGGSDAERRYTLNELGFRIERPLSKEKPPGELRIFVLGGSTVFVGAPLANTIPGRLEAELAGLGLSGVRVYNFGVISAVSGQELALLTHLLADYSPDVVLSYGGGNDIASPFLYDPRPGHPYNFVTIEAGAHMIAGALDTPTAIRNLVFASRAADWLFRRRAQDLRLPLDRLRKDAGYRTPQWEQAIVAAYLNNLRRMCRLGAAFRFKFHAVLQPLAFQNAYWTPGSNAGLADFADYARRQIDRIAAEFPALQAELSGDDCRFTDLSRIFFNDRRSLYWDFIHLNNEGNHSIAAAIAKELSVRLNKP